MSSVGPQLPAHLQPKRKHNGEGNDEHSSRSSSPESASKKRRVIGPAPPPAPLDERPTTNDHSDSESSSEDEYGPALPSRANESAAPKSVFDEELGNDALPEKKAKRDEWMTMAPKQDDLSARMDPTKIRARKFNTGKGAKGPNGSDGDSSVWMETPEQKRKRLEDEVLGRTQQVSNTPDTARERKARKEDEDKAAKIREHNEKHRNRSLYSQHQKSWQKEKEDDPSVRAFDYEKDMGGGKKIGHVEKKNLLGRASDFGSKFSGGSYL